MDRICTTCGKTGKLSDFYPNSRSKDGYQKHCKECHARMSKRWRLAHIDPYRESRREYKRKYYAANPERSREQNRRTYQKNKDRVRAKENAKNRILQQEVVLAYGGQCACCGEKRLFFLCLDHKDNDGNIHRKEIKSTISVWAKKNNYPDRLQVLCYNCNSAKARSGGRCPCPA